MKAKFLFLISVVMFICCIAYNLKDDHSYNISLLNIEALATPENGSIFCLGAGSVDCPINQMKVYLVRL